MQDTGVAETWYDGYTASVREDEDEDGIPEYRLTIQVGKMPSHFSRGYRTLEEVNAEVLAHQEWSPVETD